MQRRPAAEFGDLQHGRRRGVAATTLFDDANGAGLTCRRNNKDYGGVTAARNNYPDATYNVPITGGTGAKACVATARYKLVPRHYWKTSVEWCDKAIATAGDKWDGFGTATGGSCQSFKDSTHVYPRYYKFGADAGTDNVTTPAFERVDLDIAKRSTATFTHTWKDSQGTTETITRTFDGATPDVSEMTNYANWFAYYRTRIQAVKTVTSLAFNDLTPGTDYRVGFHTLSNTPTTTFQNIGLFDAAQRKAWVQKLFGVAITLEKDTPNLDAMVARWRVLRQRRQRRPGRGDRPDRALLPEELAHAVHRWNHQPAEAPDERRAEPGQDGAHAARAGDLDPGADTGPAVAAAVHRRIDAQPTTPRPTTQPITG